jgi:hypothetical protein
VHFTASLTICRFPGTRTIPDDVRRQIIALALELPELSPRGLAVRLTDEQKYFVSEASVYRLLKAHDLVTSCPDAATADIDRKAYPVR